MSPIFMKFVLLYLIGHSNYMRCVLWGEWVSGLLLCLMSPLTIGDVGGKGVDVSPARTRACHEGDNPQRRSMKEWVGESFASQR